jgi:hypothetical protein
MSDSNVTHLIADGRITRRPKEGDATGRTVKIRYADNEMGWAEHLRGSQYRIDNVPLTNRLNIDDVVRCRLNDHGELVVSRRLKRRYPEKTVVCYERVGQYRLLRQKVLAAEGKIEGLVGPECGTPAIALVAHDDDFDPLAAAREVGIEDPEGILTSWKSESNMHYELTWHNKWRTADAKTIDDMIDSLQAAADELRAMKARGVTLYDNGGAEDDHAMLVTEDPAVAKEFDFDPAEWDEAEDNVG